MEVAAIIIAFVALGVAFWQGIMSKNQLDLAKSTKSETEKLLEKIDRKTDEIKRLAETTEANTREQVNTLLKNFDPSVQAQNKMLESVGPALLQQLFGSSLIQQKFEEEIKNSFGKSSDNQ